LFLFGGRYSEWPDEALKSVAMTYLSELPELDSETVLNGVVVTCVAVHQTVVQRSEQFLAEMGRKNYVTPTAYLELLGTFAKLLGKKKQELLKLRARTANGLEKLLATAKEVAFLQEELTVC
jgi:dynein heavy chain